MTLVTVAPAAVMFLMASTTWPPVVTMSSTRTTFFALLEFSFDGLGRAVVFLGVAYDEERHARGEAGGGGEGDGAQFRAGDAVGARGEAAGDFLAHGFQHVGLSFKEVFVEVNF